MKVGDLIMPTDNMWGADAPFGIIISVDHGHFSPLYKVFWIGNNKVNTCIGSHIDLAVRHSHLWDGGE